MKIFGAEYLNELSNQAKISSRHRQHRNIHETYDEPCQRLFNALEPSSYIRPHRHATDQKNELLIAIRGSMTCVTFDSQGVVIDAVRFGIDVRDSKVNCGVEVPSNVWHTVIAHEPGCVLLEVKAGPFNPKESKDLALWAPEEGSSSADEYLRRLILIIKEMHSRSICLVGR